MTCKAKNLVRVSPEIYSPPRRKSKRYFPIIGIEPAICVPTLVANNDSSFHGRRYPENPNVNNMNIRNVPLIQISSLGGRYDFRKKVENIWINAIAIIKFEHQACSERKKEPKGRYLAMNETDSYAVSIVGL